VSDFDAQMDDWRKTLWATGPCPDSSQENFTLTAAEREAVERAADLIDAKTCGDSSTLRALLARLSPPAT